MIEVLGVLAFIVAIPVLTVLHERWVDFLARDLARREIERHERLQAFRQAMEG